MTSLYQASVVSVRQCAAALSLAAAVFPPVARALSVFLFPDGSPETPPSHRSQGTEGRFHPVCPSWYC